MTRPITFVPERTRSPCTPSRAFLCLLLLTLFALATSATAATTYYVSPSGNDGNPGTSSKPFLTIQYAINAASNGDTVTLADGTYTGPSDVDLDFGGRNITLNSVNGASKTTIDCGGDANNNIQHRAFYFNGVTAAVVGVTIKNGFTGSGGGVYDDYSTITFTHCTFVNNTAVNGGGIYNGFDGVITLVGCTFLNNSLVPGGDSLGGGIYSNGSATLTGCTFTGNTALGYGGGFFNTHQTTVTNCTFLGNHANNSGGGFYNDPNNNVLVTNCVFSGNTTTYGNGGAVYNNEPSSSSSLTLQFCTFAGNSTGGDTSQGGAVDNNGTAYIIDSILYGNTAPAGAEIGLGASSVTTVTYSDIKGGYDGMGNINAKPLFVHTPDPAADPPNFGDLHLGTGSPVIGKGMALSGVTADRDGRTRKDPPAIGAYEFWPGIFSLSPSSAAAGSPAFTLAVSGYGFVSNSTIEWNGTAQTTTSISPTKLTASIPAALVKTAGTASVTVVDPGVGTSNSKTFTVNAIALLAVSFSPTSVVGGSANTTGTVTLSAPAPAGGATVSLNSSSSALTFSASTVTVPEGATSATFRAYSHKVTSTATVTVTATYSGASKTATVTVTPATTGTVSLSGVSFSPTTVKGGTANTTGTVTLSAPAPSSGAVVSLSSNNGAITFPASTVTVAAGATSATFRAYSHKVTSTKTVTVTATYAGTSQTATVTVTP